MKPELYVVEKTPAPISIKKRINRRAWACARENLQGLHARYRAGLVEALADGRIEVEQIETWRPAPNQ